MKTDYQAVDRATPDQILAYKVPQHEFRHAWCRHVASIVVAATLTFASPLRAAEGFFLGDSIGEDVAQTTGQRGVAKPSVSLRGSDIILQFSRLPKGAIALMSLGLNDAADPLEALQPSIERVIAAALATGEKFVWVGPPCVLKKWDTRADKLDAFLNGRLAATGIQYVSLRDPKICQAGLRTRDGEHFTPSGYLYVWQKIQRDSSYAAEIEIMTPAPVVQAEAGVRPRFQRPRSESRRSSAWERAKLLRVKASRRMSAARQVAFEKARPKAH